MNDEDDKLKALMGAKRFDVEHALGMYALSFFHFPAKHLYDSDLLERLGERVQNSHIYLVGFVPRIDLVGARQNGRKLLVEFKKSGAALEVELPIPEGLELDYLEETWHLTDEEGNRYAPTDEQLMQAFTLQHGIPEFEVVYVGQAYGKDGSRSAIDRLRKHETLQKIALTGVPDGYRLELLLLEIEPATTMFTVLNPWAKDSSAGKDRIGKGLDKLFGTSEHERITLYEASLIRHFRPHYNTEFKNSFPSTNLKVLADCYDKDFAAVVAEICFDIPPFQLFSESAPVQRDIVIRHDLHNGEDRKIFFSRE